MVNDDVPDCKKYGVPLYGAAWIPPAALRAILNSSKDDNDSTSPPPSNAAAENYILLAGGGGEGHSGIPNAILVAKFDYESNSLSDQPVARLGTEKELPYRISVHPGGEGVICSLPKSCRWYEWDSAGSEDARNLDLRSSERVLNSLEDVGQQLALAFNGDGSLLATGGEDGKLRVFKWPVMELILNEDKAHTSVKGLHFSPDGKFLVSVGTGPARVWDVTNSTAIASLQKNNDELFGFCKFSQAQDGNQVLYIAAMQGQGGSIFKWNTTSWKKISSNRVVRDTVSAFDVSADGKLLALGTIEGDILILSSNSMRVQTVVKKAHLGLVTALMFSQDSRSLVSASLDSSARVTQMTQMKDEKKTVLLDFAHQDQEFLNFRRRSCHMEQNQEEDGVATGVVESPIPQQMTTISRHQFGEAEDGFSITIIENIKEEYGLFVWPCSIILAEYVWQHRSRFSGATVIELGAGTSLPGILAAKAGADVTLTDDFNRPEVLANMKRQCELNNVNCKVLGLTWGVWDEPIFSLCPDIILGADVLYETSAFDDLFASVTFLLQNSPSSVFITAYHNRSGHHLIEFLMIKWGLKCVKLLDVFSFMPADKASELSGNIHLVEIILDTGNLS